MQNVKMKQVHQLQPVVDPFPLPHALTQYYNTLPFLPLVYIYMSYPNPLPFIRFPPNYPCEPPMFEIEIENNQSGSFSYTNADELYDRLMKESYKWIGQMMIYELLVTAQDYMRSMLEA